MIEQSRQRRKLPKATMSPAVINLLHVNRAIDMLFESPQCEKHPMADVALVAAAVPTGGRNYSGNWRGRAILNELLRDDVVGVTVSDVVEESIAIEVTGVGARAGFDVVSEARGGGEGAATEETDHVGALVGSGSKVLEGRKPSYDFSRCGDGVLTMRRLFLFLKPRAQRSQ